MSGGLDSAVACLLLRQQGYEVYGATLRIYDSHDYPLGMQGRPVGGEQEIEDARQVAQKLGMPHHVVDVRPAFSHTVIAHFIEEYMAGRTPHPCVRCNKSIKWEALLNKADQLGCAFLATGHYAQIAQEKGRFFVRKGVDPSKEQSYMLWQLEQSALRRTLFPLGAMKKEEVRRIALAHGLSRVAQKRESFAICFIPDGNYRSYLRRKVEDVVNKYGHGNFVDKEGRFLGHHNGYMFFTIGQHKGLPNVGYRAYVHEIRPQTNEVVIGPREGLYFSRLLLNGLNSMKYESIPEDIELSVNLQYHCPGNGAHFQQREGDRGVLLFHKPILASAPGQSAVCYFGDELLGGGIIISQTH